MNSLTSEIVGSDFRGQIFDPATPGYDAARGIWNASIDRKPALIVRAAGVADVISAVRLARDQGLDLAIRGGGHNIAGKASTDGGVLLSLAGMRSVKVDPGNRIAYAAGGATLGDLDHETQAFGLATPGGVVSTTGLAGLALGGGFGWLARKFGLTADNLIAADVVTADGKLVRTSAAENDDLYWALRGGSGNFGIVVGFELGLHPVGPEVQFGPTLYRLEDAPSVLRQWRDFCRDAPRELCIWTDLLTAPPFPFLPEEHHGRKVLSLLACHMGDASTSAKDLAPLNEFAMPIGQALGPMPYCVAQGMLDETYAFGAHNYWTSQNYVDLPDGAIDAAIDLAEALPTPQSDILFCQLGGAIDDIDQAATAYPHRGVSTIITPGARWHGEENTPACMDWISACREKLAPGADGGSYVNFIAEDDGRERDAYGANFDRLSAVKKRWDPDNFFRQNQNVTPS